MGAEQTAVKNNKQCRNIDDLVAKVRAYNTAADIELLKRAYWMSSEAHGLAKRQSGTPYMEHPLAVSCILAEMRMDVTTLAAALLHDTIEDTHVTVDDIRKRFGYDVAFLVDALTKMSRIEFKSREVEQAENFRKMLLSMFEDIRVVLVKFADRLHNMRTLQFLPEEKRYRIASETLEIYAPLANRLGIGWLKTELEDLSFKYILPAVHDEIEKNVAKKRAEQEGYIKALIASVTKKIEESGIPARVLGRVKHFYGIYQKMQQQGIPFEQVHDVLGIRIISDTKANCYGLLGLIHEIYKPIPGKFKDYIGVPKANMYQSLHTTVIGPGGERVEFQIRTEDMHKVAEEGIASHWKYKERGAFKGRDDKYISWLRELVQTQKEEGTDARSFVEAVKSEVSPDLIYVFTPKGEIKELPEGSTPVDFAYSIHSEVGHRCVGARVDGRMVPLRHVLQSGSTVDIITSQAHKPSRDWLKFAVTQRAKGRIKQWLKAEERKQSIALGTKLMEEELKKHNMPVTLLKSKEIKEAAAAFKAEDVDSLLAEVGYGKISPHQLMNRLPGRPQVVEQKTERPMKEQKGITIKGIDGVLYHTAKCCFPIPGDELFGFITRGKGVAVHRRDCKNLDSLAVDEARLIEVDWKPDAETTSYARIVVDAIDKPGIIANLSAVISSAKVNISHLEATTSYQDRMARILLILEVTDRMQFNSILNKIAQTDGVMRAKRY